ncbi:RDD family protein [Flavobacterium zhairuonense]|uniref:RDD family protein n=1 Tax=Flavobacterium zhairuonense TaxID=2493631 RepID=UPI001046A554|nr:RDD family protein [Flavobacterium zhairuonense]KAF2507916.1 RDD family protein [Flavobacterium zhairuonense]
MSNSTYVLDDKLLASTGQRFLNYILDTAVVFVLVFCLGIFLALLATLLGLPGLLSWLENISTLEDRLLFILINIIYYVFTEGLFGRSVGKLITGTVVVDENGLKPAFDVILKRSLCRIIPFDGLSFFGSRGWHDSISDTYVVNKKDLEEELKSFYEFNLIGNNEVI